MDRDNKTKCMFANVIQEMAKKKSIREIRIKDICEACGVERTTFYYHFKDKQDLIAWIFAQYYMEEAENATILNGEEMLLKMFSRINEHRAFFLNALQDTSQNNLMQYIFDFYTNYGRKLLCQYSGTDILDDETEYNLRFMAYGCMGHMIEWLKDKSPRSPEQMAYYFYKYMPYDLKKAFELDGVSAETNKGKEYLK